MGLAWSRIVAWLLFGTLAPAPASKPAPARRVVERSSRRLAPQTEPVRRRETARSSPPARSRDEQIFDDTQGRVSVVDDVDPDVAAERDAQLEALGPDRRSGPAYYGTPEDDAELAVVPSQRPVDNAGEVVYSRRRGYQARAYAAPPQAAPAPLGLGGGGTTMPPRQPLAPAGVAQTTSAPLPAAPQSPSSMTQPLRGHAYAAAAPMPAAPQIPDSMKAPFWGHAYPAPAPRAASFSNPSSMTAPFRGAQGGEGPDPAEDQ